jgi:hypothetical protein
MPGRDLFNELPPETRLQIFRLATIKPSQAEDTRAEYRPFDPVALRDRDWSNSHQTALCVKATIVLVCKEWKSIVTEMLYECIRIRHGTHNLLSALESTPRCRFGRRFRVRLRSMGPVRRDQFRNHGF